LSLRVRDLAATGLVVVLVAVYLGFLAYGELPLIENTRDMTALALILGGAVIYVLLGVEQYDAVGWIILAAAVVAVVLGVLALILAETAAADVLLAAFVATVLIVWAIELTEHISFPTPHHR
jgi:hypothetical protein